MGHFNNSIDLKVKKLDGTTEEFLFKNLVTSQGHTAYIDGGLPSYIALGTGAHVEAPTINALEKFSVMVNGSWREVGSQVIDVEANTISRSFQIVKTFPVEKSNKLYSEIGVVDNTQKAFTYARLRDSLGNPTTITVLANEQIEVTYTMTVSLKYKTVDENTGYVCYLHNIPAVHKSRDAIWTSTAASKYFRLFYDSIDRLDSGLLPAEFSGSRSSAMYHKRSNVISTEIPNAIGGSDNLFTGVHCEPPDVNNDFSFTIVFPDPSAITGDAYFKFSITIPYLGA